MSNQLNFLLNQALQYIQSSNFASASLLLNQVVKNKPDHSEALRLSAYIAAQQGNNEIALAEIKKAIFADKKNALAYSNQGNIQMSLGMTPEAIASYEMAIKLMPMYSEAYSNLGNAYQDQHENIKAIDLYRKAISMDPQNPDFFCNLGNCLKAIKQDEDACVAYKKAIELYPNHADANYYLSLLNLQNFNFHEGWLGSEWRWKSSNFNSPRLNSSRPEWAGQKVSGTIFVWAEQGLGDQVLYASMLREMQDLADHLIVSADPKILPVLRRSFPTYHFIDKNEVLSEDSYNYQIPIGSIGQYLRRGIDDFKRVGKPYLHCLKSNSKNYQNFEQSTNKVICGLSWRSNNQKVGSKKSILLSQLLPIFELASKIKFINLQYGNTDEEREHIKANHGFSMTTISGLDLYDDIDGLTVALESCNIVVTTSNSIAHISGAMGKETLLLVPYSAGKFWYWHSLDKTSLWYPSIKIFRQSIPGDWLNPVNELKKYLELKFAI